MTTPTTFDALREAQTALIRKALAGAVFLAPLSSTLPATLTTGASSALATLPTGYEDLGLISKDNALTWSRDIETNETTSWGFADPTRRDIVSDVTGLQFTAQETKLRTLELYEGVDLSAVTPDATTGEVAFSRPLRPATRYYRAFAIAVDGDGTDAIFIGRLLPRAMVSERGEQTWTDSGEIAYQMTLTATPDTTAGYSIRHFFGGPGWKSLLASMGFGS
ncbi:hypothetical protein JOF41_007376 [Saccharothrix coeruleofusca]|uniref:phage tail tube protein n=1 Tax=Saccharothrix coeruleofusca TaxID=33919 RepID=UPI001AE35A53|nr:hypothetical protein [Saccharothrix coeruleofusca]MBP2341122.1 hypothetical protein [Saccharothrix coeruleofusca]